jgi:hypothetical protein
MKSGGAFSKPPRRFIESLLNAAKQNAEGFSLYRVCHGADAPVVSLALPGHKFPTYMSLLG